MTVLAIRLISQQGKRQQKIPLWFHGAYPRSTVLSEGITSECENGGNGDFECQSVKGGPCVCCA